MFVGGLGRSRIPGLCPRMREIAAARATEKLGPVVAKWEGDTLGPIRFEAGGMALHSLGKLPNFCP